MRGILRRRGIDEGVQYALNRLLHYAVLADRRSSWRSTTWASPSPPSPGSAPSWPSGIGFGLQNIAQNFVSGLILLLERPVKKGDFVEVGDTRGTVREIHARATVVTTVDNVDILVPNGQFITEPVVNQTFETRDGSGSAWTWAWPTAATPTWCAHPGARGRGSTRWCCRSPAPKVWFTDFGDSSLDFSLLVWIPEPILQPQIASDLRFAIDAAFREAGDRDPLPPAGPAPEEQRSAILSVEC